MTAFSPSNLQIQPYVNGALYSILSIPAIREEARAMVRNAPDACVGPVPATEQSSPGSAPRSGFLGAHELPDVTGQIHVCDFLMRIWFSGDP